MEDIKDFEEYNKLIERLNKHNLDHKNYNLLVDKLNIEIESIQRKHRALIKSSSGSVGGSGAN